MTSLWSNDSWGPSTGSVASHWTQVGALLIVFPRSGPSWHPSVLFSAGFISQNIILLTPNSELPLAHNALQELCVSLYPSLAIWTYWFLLHGCGFGSSELCPITSFCDFLCPGYPHLLRHYLHSFLPEQHSLRKPSLLGTPIIGSLNTLTFLHGTS